MLIRIKEQLRGVSQEFQLFGAWAILSFFSFLLGVGMEWYALFGLPLLLLLGFIVLVDTKKIFFLLMATVPLSTEIVLPNGFGTDLPTEPLTVGLMVLAGFIFLARIDRLSLGVFTHPITIILLLHVLWIYFTTMHSDLPFTSIKFSLAKTWYVVVFYFLALYLLSREADYRRLIWWIFWPLAFTVIFIMVRHASSGFAFDQVHKVLHPFQRNHVSYAATLALFIPFIWFLFGLEERRSIRWWALGFVLIWFLVAVYLTYTRAAYVALFLAVVAYYIFRLRLIRVVLFSGLIITIVAVGYVLSDNRYLDFAPNYDTTTSHRDFGNLLEATAKGEDISTMERVYRWVAAVQMSQDAPLVGFGPGNFVAFYQSYSVSSFRTYVSRNEEKSGVHSYFLLILVEQGWPGLILFLALSVYIFIRGEHIYHACQVPERKRLIMAVLLALVVIYAFLIINDMIETDKVGSFFFLCIAALVRMDLLNTRELLEESDSGKYGQQAYNQTDGSIE